VGPTLAFSFDGEVIHWCGPSPFHFVALPEDEASLVDDVKRAVTYGWGVIPVGARIGRTSFTTSLFPKHGTYLVPVKDAVRRTEGIEVGDAVTVHLTIDTSRA
jgi:hypothetical protein